MDHNLNKAKLFLLLVLLWPLASCSDKDFYDPDLQNDNPLGEVIAPTGFDWSLISRVNLNIAVDDNFNGQYYYLIEVFDANPLTNQNAKTLAKGVAKDEINFTTQIAVDKNQETIFIKQTDPKGRSIVRCYQVTDGFNATFTTKTASTRSVSTRATVDIPAVPEEYQNIPSDAIVLSDPSLNTELVSGKSYVINQNYTGPLKYWANNGNNIKLYIDQGVKWTITDKQSFQGYLSVILTQGASIEAKEISFVNGSDLIITPEASLTAENLSFTDNGSTFLNWGSLSTGELSMPNTNDTKNYGTMNADKIKLPDNADFMNNGTIEAINLELHTNTKLTNNQKIIITGTLKTTDSQSIITNNYYFECPTVNLTNATLNNNCYFICESDFYANGAKINLDKGYIVAPNMTFSGTTVVFKNGSMIEAWNQIDHTTHASTYDGGTDIRSLIKAAKIIGQGFKYKGNLTVECDEHVEKSPYWENFTIESTVDLTLRGESTVFIEDCITIRNGGNEGKEPEDPQFPIINTDGKSYTYLFEDQWPFYGDYDMNDIVLNVKNLTYTSNQNNLVEKFQFDFTLMAIGAIKELAVATSLENVDPGNVKSVSYSSYTPVTFDVNNGVETGQHTAVIPLIDNAHRFLGLNRIDFVNTLSVNRTDLPTITVIVEFNNPVAMTDLSINDFNAFIMVDVNLINVKSNQRKEVHAYGFAPTSKADTSYFGLNDDDSKSYTYYASRDNLAWGIIVPEDFKWAKEFTPLTEAYAGFKSWITSGGITNTDWYTNPVTDKVISVN